ncbi:DUF3221 domain-containing protein [Halobacillus aidingensis]|uniref:DUF3221 domain-containing protein n=1 Tax=Halobacillus aidingensis TaxID=240303 RepID=A0A1H0UD93_HALAD|nr:DUF3221 domain-containing protein [Halobacillus aidingensis]SDP64144.1 Protein of unknown function [Halobacillus aidingensis]
MKKILLFLLTAFVLSACSQQAQNDEKTTLENQEGIVALKKERGESSQILLIPNIKEEDINNKTEPEIIEMAQENKGAYYDVSTDDYNEIDIGANIIIYWNGNQEDSDPPQRGAKKIEKV